MLIAIEKKIKYFIESDYITTIILFIILCCSIFVPYTERTFFEQDLTLSYPFDGDQVPAPEMLYPIIIGIPFIIVTFICIIEYRMNNDNNILYGYISSLKLAADSLLLTSCITEYLKHIIGSIRPSFYYLCDYSGYRDCIDFNECNLYYNTTQFGLLGNLDKCQDKNNIHDAIVSFPSGHTSMSFSMMSFLVFCLQQYFKSNHILTYSQLLISFWIGITRIQDNKHREIDVLAGASIGIICFIITVGKYINIKK